MWRMIGWCLAVMTLLTACALWEEPPAAPLPPLTLPPQPTLVFAGSCDNNRELADWLQYSTYYVGQFADFMTTAAAGDRAAIRTSALDMAAMRAEYGQVETPDCAEPAQRMFFNAMDRAITGFQEYANGDSSDVEQLLTAVNGEVDRIKLEQDNLRARLEIQLQESTEEGE